MLRDALEMIRLYQRAKQEITVDDAEELLRLYQRGKRELQARGYSFEQVAVALIVMLRDKGYLN